MERQQFWESLKQKYEEKNRILQQREKELRLKLEAMNMVVGDSVNATCKIPDTDIEQVLAKSSPIKQSIHSRSIRSQIKPDSLIARDLINEPAFRSCSCTPPLPPPEKTGLFNCIWSIFGSSKEKSPAKAPVTAPLVAENRFTGKASIPSTFNPPVTSSRYDEPTKDAVPQFEPARKEQPLDSAITPNDLAEKPQAIIDYNVVKNENCSCKVCVAEFPHGQNGQKPVDLNQRFLKSDSCICTLESQNISSALNTDETHIPTTAQVVGSIKAGSGSIASGDKDTPTEMKRMGLPSPSQLSLKSVDLFYMKDIHDLAARQQSLLHEINSLENREKIYEEVFREYRETGFSHMKKNSRLCTCFDTQDSGEKTNAELKLENVLLKNELKEMRLEVRQYLERMEGPMQFKIETERYKCIQLEQKLEGAAKEHVMLQEFYEKEMNSLKMILCTANNNIFDLTTQNEQLCETLNLFKEKCDRLEEDLIRQKISEAETIKNLQAALLQARALGATSKDECNLHEIARELSKVLKECEPCGDCVTLPDDLISAAQLLKSLTDLVEAKLRDENENIPSKIPLTTQGRGSIKDKSSRTSGTLEISVVQEQSGVPSVKSMSQAEERSLGSRPKSLNQSEQGVPPVTKERLSKAEERSVSISPTLTENGVSPVFEERISKAESEASDQPEKSTT